MKTILIFLVLSGTARAQFCSTVRTVRTVQPVRSYAIKSAIQYPVKKYDVLFLVAPPGYYGAREVAAPHDEPQQVTQDGQQQVLETLTKVVSGLSRLEQRINTDLSDITRRLDQLEQGGVEDIPPPPPVAVPRVLEQQCGLCHGGEEARGDFRLSDLAIPRKRDMAKAMISNERMPVDPEGMPVQVAPHIREQLLSALEFMQ